MCVCVVVEEGGGGVGVEETSAVRPYLQLLNFNMFPNVDIFFFSVVEYSKSIFHSIWNE